LFNNISSVFQFVGIEHLLYGFSQDFMYPVSLMLLF